jgi:hypothetical protein
VIEKEGRVPLFLSQAGMYRNTGETAVPQQFIQFDRPCHALYEDNDLVEVEGVQEIIEFAVLLAFLKADKVLLAPMKGEL